MQAGKAPTMRTPQVTGSGPIRSDGIHIPTNNGELLITRRQFLYGAIGIGAIIGVSAAATSLSAAEREKSAVTTISVPTTSVFTLDGCTEVAVEQTFTKIGDYEMPFATLIWANGDDIAACLLPTATASPLTQVGLLMLGTGNSYTVLESAVGASEGFEIYDVRANMNGLVWTEANILNGAWRIYTATLSSQISLGTPQKVDEGGSDWETPTLGISGKHAYWQLMPSISSSQVKTATASLKRVDLGGTQVDTLYTSKGRMASPLYSCDDGVVITPKCAKSSSYYELVHVDDATGQQDDGIILPSAMKPNQVGYGPTGFAFCFESIYSYGDGIANLGTYTPAASHADNDYDGLKWFRFGRTPQASPCWCTNDWFVVKSTQSVCAVNLTDRTYSVFGTESGCTDWGDYLCSSGKNSTVVSAIQINQTETSGAVTKKCLVRVWEPLKS